MLGNHQALVAYLITKACQGYWCSRTDSAWLLVFPAVASCGPTQRRIPRFQPNHFRSFEIAGALSASPEGRTQRLVGNFIDSSLFKKSRSKVVLLNKKKRYSTTASAYWKYLNICNLCIYCYVRSTSFNPTCEMKTHMFKPLILFKASSPLRKPHLHSDPANQCHH